MLKPSSIRIVSDTRSELTDGIRQFILAAEVGDEQQDEEPIMTDSCSKVTKLLGKYTVVLLLSDTMYNEIARAIHCRPGIELICDATAHIITFEKGGPTTLSGFMVHIPQGKYSVYSPDQLSKALARL